MTETQKTSDKQIQAKKIALWHDKVLNIYKKFLEIRGDIERPGKLAEYDWYSLPNKLPFELSPYSHMLAEHSREISNSINELYRYITNLRAWDTIIHDLDDDFKYDLILEFISPFATLSINLIYAIRSRFIFSIAHLCHQANALKMRHEWKDDLPSDDEIYFDVADNKGKLWKSYSKLKLSLEKSGNNQFKTDTKDFRNKYHHRYSPRIELGHAEFVTRRREDNKVSYGMGGSTGPLKISELVPILTKQYLLFIECYEHYKKLIYEHIDAIQKFLEEIQFNF